MRPQLFSNGAGLQGPRRFGGAALFVIVGLLYTPACAQSADIEDDRHGDSGAGFVAPSTEGGATGPGAVDLVDGRCATSSCVDSFRTCPDSKFPCDVDILSDSKNCGSCGVECPSDAALQAVYNAKWTCSNGTCAEICVNDRLDCDKDITDGCEVDGTCDPNNCGKCGNVCPLGTTCEGGACGCPAPQTQCGPAGCRNDGTTSCTDLSYDNNNCGGCGNVCPPPPAGPPLPQGTQLTCVGGACNQVSCIAFAGATFADCNGKMADGCEVNITASDPANCGACGHTCAAGQTCDHGSCLCPASLSLCHVTFPIAQAVCADFTTDSDHCGSCDSSCPDARARVDGFDPHGARTCSAGLCGYTCESNWADCNGNIGDGCEIQVEKDPHNCGGCGIQCDSASGQACIRGQCATVPCKVVPR